MLTSMVGPEAGFSPPAEVSRLREHCGVWGMWDRNNQHVLQDAFIGLNGIQHRGEGGAGVAVISPGHEGIEYARGRGKVVEVFGEDGSGLSKMLPGDAFAAIAQTHWPTDGGIPEDGTQPRKAELLAVAHNGQITNKEDLSRKYSITEYTSDTDLVTKIFNQEAMALGGDVERAITKVLPDLRGAFCLTILTTDKLIGIKDRNSVRPLQLGRTATGGYILASENMAIENIPGATWEREIEPAEMVVIDGNGLRSGVGNWDETADPSLVWAAPDPAACLVEYLYFANKNTKHNGLWVGETRRKIGKVVAGLLSPELREAAQAAIPVPNGANQFVHGMAEATGIPFVPLLELNPKIKYGRAFIQSGKQAQTKKAQEKLVVDVTQVEHVVDKVVIVGDDSLASGNTLGANLPKVKSAEPSEVHVAVFSPMWVSTCPLGVDVPPPNDLIAPRLNGDKGAIAAELDVASVTYPELADIEEVVGRKICGACFGGYKPNALPAIEISEKPRQLPEHLVLAAAAA